VLALVIWNGTLLAVCAVAARALWRDPRRRPPELGPIVVLLALAFAVHLPFSAQPRMLFPLVPLLIWVCAHALGGGAPGGGAPGPRPKRLLGPR